MSRDDSAGEEPRTELRERSEPIRVYSPTRGTWDYSYDELDPRTAAEMDREWRAMKPAQKAWGLAGAILILSPIIATFALMPFAFAADGEARERLERLMATLFIGQFALLFLVIVIAKLLPRKSDAEGPRPE